MSTADVTGVREGDVLAGKYRIDKILGVGGMGVVVAAHHLDLDEKVAIKFLLPDMLSQGEAVARFAREARAAVKIKSEHVARVTDVGKLETGAPYMVMEYLEGSDLAAWLGQRGALQPEQAVDFVLQACEALAEAHSLGIVHRDLKPANLFVIRGPDGALSIKVLDFGISKLVGLMGSGGGPAMTKTSALMGSPLYMSPEQMQSSRDVDARCDIWALGVVLYELIAGSPPFAAETMTEFVLLVAQGGPPPSLRRGRPDLPAGLEQVILKCLERDRRARYQSIGELAVALLPFGPKRSRRSVERISGVLRAAGFPGATTALPPSSGNEVAATSAGTPAPWGKTMAPGGRSRWLAAGGVALALGAGGVAWQAIREPSAERPKQSLERSGKAASAAPPAPTAMPSVTALEAAAPTPPTSASAAPAVVPTSARPTPKTRRPSPIRAASPAVLPTTQPPPTPVKHEPPATKPDIFDDRK